MLLVVAIGGSMPLAIRQIVGIGGLFICSLSALQFREIIQRKEKLGICETLRSYLALLQGQPTLDAETRARVDQLLFQAFESAVKVKPS